MTTKRVRSLTSTYLEMVDDIDFILAHDTCCKGVMKQRLLSVKAWLNEEVGQRPAANVLSAPAEGPGKVKLILESDAAPLNVPIEQLQSAIATVLEDWISGEVHYHGFNDGGGYWNFYLSGPCPIHKRVHDGQAWKWVLKQKKNKDHAGFKCWRDNQFQKLASIDQLT